MKKEYILLTISTITALAVAALILRFFEPRLFGVPTDLKVVKLSKEVPPFYNNIFRSSDLKSLKLQINDPVTGVRGKPLFPALPAVGPHDLLGFRNRRVPNQVDIVAIGDSQTYGNNATRIESWPYALQKIPGTENASVYSMAMGGWAAPQYLEMFKNAYALSPQVIVVALYTGNDGLESFRTVYNNEYWESFRPDPELSASNAPKSRFPPPENEIFKAENSRESFLFTPKHRLISNDRKERAVVAGYKIIQRTLSEIDIIAAQLSPSVYITIIPTKELIFEELHKKNKIKLSADYLELLKNEKGNIAELKKHLAALNSLEYIDLISVLKQRILIDQSIYPTNSDGHPTAAGYQVIAEVVSKHISGSLSELVEGGYKTSLSSLGTLYYLYRNNELWLFESEEAARQNGWSTAEFKEINPDRLQRLELKGRITESVRKFNRDAR